jgi:trk system potassium uptake protein TrkA
MAWSVATAVDQEHPAELLLTPDTVVAEVPVPDGFLSRTLRELDIRERFGVSVLMIKRDSPGGVRINEAPTADYAFQPGDIMLVMGPADRLRALKRGVSGS